MDTVKVRRLGTGLLFLSMGIGEMIVDLPDPLDLLDGILAAVN